MRLRLFALLALSAACAGSALDSSGDDLQTTCATRITYGGAWMRPAGHTSDFDDAAGSVTWDGKCAADGANSYATLSNGWAPHFAGHDACVLALDTRGCGQTSACATRVTYGSAWIPAPNHPASYDDAGGRVEWDRACVNGSSSSQALLSNGWTPNFHGTNSCELSFRYSQCGGLYQNPVIPFDCPDPGVLLDNGTYYLSCTSGNAASSFPIYTSKDLIHWAAAGHIFPLGHRPIWAVSDFWAPEIHKVSGKYVAYFAARDRQGRLAVGAASATSPLGPFTSPTAPVVSTNSLGVIDPTEFDDDSGHHYLVWKVDGNAVRAPTPIYAQQLSADGLSLSGTARQLITNDLSWEGAVTEAPFVIHHGSDYYLFYSGNSYANATYAIGVARAANPLGPYTKLGAPIVKTKGKWIGPGHNSVVTAPSGELALVYHAWDGAPGTARDVLVDLLAWDNGWPRALEAPTASSQPMP